MRALSMMIAGIVALLASPSLATERSELEKATIKAASDCVAAAALNILISRCFIERVD
jgi:hypothetical protein